MKQEPVPAAASALLPDRNAAFDADWGFTAHPDGQALGVQRVGRQLLVGPPGERAHDRWLLRDTGGAPALEWLGPCAAEPEEAHLLAALEAAFILHPQHASLALAGPVPSALRDTGVVTGARSARPIAERDALWQQPRLWLPAAREPRALQYAVTEGRRHPRRPPKPAGVVYRRYIPWLARTLTLRSIDLARDLPTFSRWMNDPVVAQFWQEEGDLAKHRTYVERIAADPHVLGLIGSFDDEPFGYFEAYWAKEDRIAPFCEAGDHDRGWHVLIGEARFRGRPFLTAWMPSISHYLFLDDCRTQRIVIEPRADNHKMRKSLARCGYALLKEFDFPHKRAVLGLLLRERFFGEALWIPQPEVSPHPKEIPCKSTT
ncbi:acetyltransferase [Variovorax sp. WS11]|uniref:GNAT family N-acetyltransferase n=1 Tax=Variovorax sp. WS11 TaxID=1105204 RepID=UPI000D0DD318|nr:GNAT family N-acetyltransferase [Variovorax sp. WS11]NDZ18052.1 acetyltransferase [Variovorax sp. WS11]PSL80016.1 acetyltransferase [Variovorax sp. WS11]